MRKIENLCKGCMRQMEKPVRFCPVCGYDHAQVERRSSNCLPEHIILAGRYLLGRVLGEGGFGITYLALDLTTEIVVAIKEYFPVGLASRDAVENGREELEILPGEAGVHYKNGLERFTREGKILAQFQNLQGIVHARDFFFANETAYLVMDYVKGQSLKQYMKWYEKNQNGVPLDYTVAVGFLTPVMQSLISIHQAGLLHRDISPDNILVDDQGKVTLIDFGSAREDVENNFRTMTVMIKHGYAPEEQYRPHGKQGPWTDVYAICATLYHMISGVLPMDAVERLIRDELRPLKEYQLPVSVPEEVSDVIEKGLAVHAVDRYQTMKELYRELTEAMKRQEQLETEQEHLSQEAEQRRKTEAVKWRRQEEEQRQKEEQRRENEQRQEEERRQKEEASKQERQIGEEERRREANAEKQNRNFEAQNNSTHASIKEDSLTATASNGKGKWSRKKKTVVIVISLVLLELFTGVLGTGRLFHNSRQTTGEKGITENERTAPTQQTQVSDRYQSMTVTYYHGGEVFQTLDGATISSWMTLDENNQPVFDYAKVQSYVAQMAADYDTIGTREPFVTSLGETVYVEARTYGWQIDQEQEAEELYRILLEGNSAERSPVYDKSAITRGENDIGDTYVEIDYTNQRMWYYKGGDLIVDTAVVTGSVANGTESPEGIFYLVSKSENEVLKGGDYETPVEYWMPFCEDVGIHDADSYRLSYGGTIFQYSGSHGCIDTPTSSAALIYQNIETGTPIVCYKATVKQ